MSVKVSVDQLSDAVEEMLSGYSEVVSAAIKEQAKDCSDQLTSDIKDTARQKLKGSGRYADGFRNKLKAEGKDYIRYVTYNKTDYQLTHLLEYGHEKWLWGKDTGDRVRAIPHIRPNADKWIEAFIKRCETVIAYGKGTK